LWLGKSVLINLQLLVKNKYCCALVWALS
jgi:hypothetical protein